MTKADDDIVTSGEVAEQFDRSQSQIRRLIEEGRIPYAQKIGNSWVLEPSAIKFLKTWMPRLTTGRSGQRNAAAMREAAGLLDPACLERYAAWAKAYPNGWVAKRAAS